MSQNINVNSNERNFTNTAANLANNQQADNNNDNRVNTGISIASNEVNVDVEQTSNVSNQTATNEVSEEEVNAALDTVSTFINNSYKQVNFSSDSSSGKTVIKIIDKETQELISQFPSEKLLSIAEKIQGLQLEIEDASGLLVDSHV